jgi:CrcB protein
LAFPSTSDIPYATGAINIGGCLVLGFLLGVLVGGDPGHHRGLRLAIGTGFCGGFTTYSTLAEQGADLAGQGLWGASVLYAVGTLLIGAVAAWTGIAAGTAKARRRDASRTVGAAR